MPAYPLVEKMQGVKRMRTPASKHDGERRLGVMLSFAFGCVFLGVVLTLAFTGSSLDDRRFEILRIVLALAGGGVGGVIPGFLDLNMKAGTKWALRAGGGLAVAGSLGRTATRLRESAHKRRKLPGD